MPKEGLFGSFIKTMSSKLHSDAVSSIARDFESTYGHDSYAARMARSAEGVFSKRHNAADAAYQQNSARAQQGGFGERLRAAFFDTTVDDLKRTSIFKPASRQPQMGRTTGATEDAINSDTSSEQAQKYYRLGIKAVEEGRHDEAWEFLQLAASADHAGAYVALSRLVFEGVSLAGSKPARDFKLAVQLVHMALDLGERRESTALLVEIGGAYLMGKGVVQDATEALRLFRIAAENGNADAQFQMAFARFGGLDGSKSDPVEDSELRRWLMLAIVQGHAEAKSFMETLNKETKEREERQTAADSPRGSGLSRSDALEILELKEGATTQEIRQAYSRLIAMIHPDKGGSTYLTRQLNAARDLLLS